MGFKILLADDSVTVQKIITLTFSDEGVDVLTVNNGDEAIHRLQYMRPALVMADVSIPGKNGYEICEYVKNHPDMKDTPVVLLVPAFEHFDEERARRIGADQHLTKPFQSIRTLITTVKTLLEGHPPKFATGSLNNSVAQVQVPEPIKAPIVQAAPTMPVEIIRPTQPFPDEPEEEITPIAEAGSEEPIVDIWKSEEVWEIEDVLDVKTEPVTFAPEPPAEVDSTIEEVIEPEPILPGDITSDAITQPNVKVLGDNLTIVAPTVAPAIVHAVQSVAQKGNSGDLDHVLDLDDVLNWPPVQPIVSPQVIVPAAPSFTPRETAIPQTAIDEIVNRVVAQLSEKLTAQLAAQLAPEVAELVKQQTQHQTIAVAQPVSPISSVTNDSDSLLDLD